MRGNKNIYYNDNNDNSNNNSNDLDINNRYDNNDDDDNDDSNYDGHYRPLSSMGNRPNSSLDVNSNTLFLSDVASLSTSSLFSCFLLLHFSLPVAISWTAAIELSILSCE